MAYKFTEKRNNIQEQTTYVLYMIVSSYFHKASVIPEHWRHRCIFIIWRCRRASRKIWRSR